MRTHKLALWSLAIAFAGLSSAAQAAIAWTASFVDRGVSYTLSDLTVSSTATTHIYRLTVDTSGYQGPSGAFLDSVNIKAWTGGSSEIRFRLLEAPGPYNAWRRTEGPITSGGLGNTGCRGGGQGGGGFACVEARNWAKGEFAVGATYDFVFSVTARHADSFLTLAEISQGAHVGAGYADAQGRGRDYGVTDYTITTAVPEPETYAMMLVGLGLLGWAARRKKKRAPA